MKSISLALLFVVFMASCTEQNRQIGITINDQSEVLSFAREELDLFLGKNYCLTSNSDEAWLLALEVDSRMEEGSFCVEHTKTGRQDKISLRGSNDVAVLHAVYTFLEKTGVRFEIGGPVIPEKIEVTRLTGYKETILPKVKQRGIKQYLNFPMDLSSYPLDEAKEYIRNVARLRFNYFACHSYPGQWYGYFKEDGQWVEPGAFFYGQRYDIPDTEFFHEKIRNQKTYCIPSIEPYYDEPVTRGQMAVAWLQQVIGECKRTGLTVRLSFESRNNTPDVQPTMATAGHILSLYPEIDELEIVTDENSNWLPPMDENAMKNFLTPFFGKDIMKDSLLSGLLLSGHSGVAALSAEIGHNIKAMQAINDSLLQPKGKKGSLGLYVVIPEYLELSYHLLRTYAPEANYAVLPGHGAHRSAANLPHAKMTRKDWGQTMVYSLLEFDGIMFLQQNSINGIRNMIEYGETVNGRQPVQSMCFLHWRTAENQITARYASEATLFGSLDEATFYTRYAQAYGIENTQAFMNAMRQIGEADWFATNNLPNVGFCFAGCWFQGGSAFGYFGNMNPANLKKGRELYEQAYEYLKQCAVNVSKPCGKDLISFLDNRLRATIVYLKTFEKGVVLQQFDAKNLTPEQRKAIAGICDETILGFEQYLRLHAEMMPDRGCEGTLISAYHTPIAILKKLRFELGDVPYDDTPVTEKTLDAPPAPITFK